MKRPEMILAEYIAHNDIERSDYEDECKENGLDPKHVSENAKLEHPHVYAVARAFLLHPYNDVKLTAQEMVEVAGDLLHASDLLKNAIEESGTAISEGHTVATKLLLKTVERMKDVSK